MCGWRGYSSGRRWDLCWGGWESPLGGWESPLGVRESPLGKSVSPVSALEGYLGGVVGESEAKRGDESPALLQRIACGGHSGDSDLLEAEMA